MKKEMTKDDVKRMTKLKKSGTQEEKNSANAMYASEGFELFKESGREKKNLKKKIDTFYY